MPCYVSAASTTDAVEPISIDQDCSLTLSYTCDGTAFQDVAVKLYKVAEVSADFQYTLTNSFSSTSLSLNGVQSSDEWNTIRCTLETYISADGILPDTEGKTNSSGAVCFEGLKPGLYLAVAGHLKQEDLECYFDSALVAVPSLDSNGLWQYEVSVASKGEIIPPIEADEEIQFKVVKLWKGDEGQKSRPGSIEVEIFRDGTLYEKAYLTKDNNWSYSWSVKDDGANWSVMERNVPSGYTMTVQKRERSFVITNTFIPKNPNGSSNAPQTGDTSNIMVFVILMILSGSMLIILGITGKRNANEESK
jgi:hypothetical protein